MRSLSAPVFSPKQNAGFLMTRLICSSRMLIICYSLPVSGWILLPFIVSIFIHLNVYIISRAAENILFSDTDTFFRFDLFLL